LGDVKAVPQPVLELMVASQLVVNVLPLAKRGSDMVQFGEVWSVAVF